MDEFLILLRWLHFLFGITWIGLLYFFNLVQTPFFGETDAPVRIGAQSKMLPRALWWFRWGAMGTVIFGLIYLLIWWDTRLNWSFTSWTAAILTGGTLGIVMFLNVWLVIWPKNKIVIASAQAVAAGGQANPAAAAAGRRGGLASRTNTLMSIPMLFFMGAASHYSFFGEASSGQITVAIIIIGGLILIVELNALIGTTGATKKPLDTIPAVITAGFVYWAILVAALALTL